MLIAGTEMRYNIVIKIHTYRIRFNTNSIFQNDFLGRTQFEFSTNLRTLFKKIAHKVHSQFKCRSVLKRIGYRPIPIPIIYRPYTSCNAFKLILLRHDKLSSEPHKIYMSCSTDCQQFKALFT